jgi:hypothetical protein
MHNHDEMLSRILGSLTVWPQPEQAEGTCALIGGVIKEMSVYRILEMRREIQSNLDENVPAVRAILDLLDGQIALREIARPATWR